MWRSPSSKSALLFAAVLVLAATFTSAQEKGGAAAPHIGFSETRYEAGKVKEGAVLSHEFEFSNDGNAALRITDLVPA